MFHYVGTCTICALPFPCKKDCNRRGKGGAETVSARTPFPSYRAPCTPSPGFHLSPFYVGGTQEQEEYMTTPFTRTAPTPTCMPSPLHTLGDTGTEPPPHQAAQMPLCTHASPSSAQAAVLQHPHLSCACPHPFVPESWDAGGACPPVSNVVVPPPPSPLRIKKIHSLCKLF